MSLTITEGKVLFKTIQGLAAFAPPALLNAGGQVKAYRKRVPDNIPLPYIVYSRMPVGGLSLSPHNRHSDSMWRVVVHTANWPDVDLFHEFVNRLDRLMPDITNTPNVVSAVSYLEEVTQVEDTTQPQNNTIFEVGGIYSLRLYFGSNQP